MRLDDVGGRIRLVIDNTLPERSGQQLDRQDRSGDPARSEGLE
ncbi:hypothetical protein [Roseinatronobacter domitianus]|nr:hypothetical protein [Roseibaca domitiana]